MAVTLTLPAPYHGMSHIWNLSANVGCDRATCPNLPDDVALVKYLISLNRQWAPLVHAACNNPPMQLNDRFDAVLGFWITVFTTGWGSSLRGDIRVLVPARGTEPSGILLINDLAHQLSPLAWGQALGRYGLAHTSALPIGTSGALVSRTAIRRP
jgi:hypothetical protein